MTNSWLDATAEADLIRRRDAKPSELVLAAFERIAALNPALNAVISIRADEAMREAEMLLDAPDAPFRGVPLLLKDYLCETKGDRYTEGLGFLRDLGWRSDGDSHLAQAFRRAGFVMIGKTNLPPMASSPSGENQFFGAARNPWDTTRSPGGSSSGSAAAVASGMVSVAHGNDGQGSIRIPASACGLVGLKPSRGRLPSGPGWSQGLMDNIVEHVLTRTVRDSAGVLDAVATSAGPGSGGQTGHTFASEVGVEPERSLRVGLLHQDLWLEHRVHPECIAAVQAAGRVLQGMGHEVQEAHPDALTGPTGLGERFLGVILATSATRAVDMWSERIGRPLTESDVGQSLWEQAQRGSRTTGTEILAAVDRLRNGICRATQWWEAGWDLLLTPTMQAPPPPEDLAPAEQTKAYGFFTMPWSFTGQPAISLPLHWTDDGLPVGVQFVAGPGREDLLFRISGLFEQTMPWAHRRPPAVTGARHLNDTT